MMSLRKQETRDTSEHLKDQTPREEHSGRVDFGIGMVQQRQQTTSKRDI